MPKLIRKKILKICYFLLMWYKLNSNNYYLIVQIEIVLEKSEKFDSLMSASQNANANGKVENKQ